MDTLFDDVEDDGPYACSALIRLKWNPGTFDTSGFSVEVRHRSKILAFETHSQMDADLERTMDNLRRAQKILLDSVLKVERDKAKWLQEERSRSRRP